WAAVKGPGVWAKPALPSRPAPAASSANIETDFPLRIFTTSPLCSDRRGSEITAAVARCPQAFALRQEPASHLGFVLAGLDMFGQQPAPEIAIRRRSLLAVHLDIKPAVAQRLELAAVERECAIYRAIHAGAGGEVQDGVARNADPFAHHDMGVGGRPGKAGEAAGDLQAVAGQGR